MKGYSIEEIQDCIVEQKDNNYILDTDHPSFPKKKKDGYNPPVIQLNNIETQPTPINTNGKVGSELKKLLSKIGIVATPNCSCNTRAKIMDDRGIAWCESNIDTIVGWLREEASKRRLPFIDAAGSILVRRAISNAKKFQPPPGDGGGDAGHSVVG